MVELFQKSGLMFVFLFFRVQRGFQTLEGLAARFHRKEFVVLNLRKGDRVMNCLLYTSTESAAVAVIYSLVVSVVIYRGLDWKGVWRVLGDCVDTLSIVLILIATSNIFGNCLTRLHVPVLAAGAIIGLTDNPILLALLLNLILLVLGCIMDMAPIILLSLIHI